MYISYVPVHDQVKDLVGSCVQTVVLAPGHTQVRVQLHHYSLENIFDKFILFEQMIHCLSCHIFTCWSDIQTDPAMA